MNLVVHANLKIRLQRVGPRRSGCEHAQHRACAWPIGVCEACDRVGDGADGAHPCVQDLLRDRRGHLEPDHVGDVEQGSRGTRQPDAIGPLDNVDRIDPPATMHDDAVQLRASPVGHERMETDVVDPAERPLSSSGGEPDHRSGIPQTDCDHPLHVAERPLATAIDARENGDEQLTFQQPRGRPPRDADGAERRGADNPMVCSKPIVEG